MSVTEKEEEKPTNKLIEESIVWEEKVDDKEEREEQEEREGKGQGGVRQKFKGRIIESLNDRKQFIKGIIIGICILMFIYFGMAIHHIDHFYSGSQINNINVAGKTVEAVEEIMEAELRKYSLSLKERGARVEQINAGDIGLGYSSEKAFKDFKASQHPLKWPKGCFFDREDLKFTIGFKFNKKLLEEQIDKLSCFDPSMVIEPENPRFTYSNRSFNIINEIAGNKVDREILYPHMGSAIKNGEEELDLDSIDAYIKPKYHSKSKEVIEAQKTLNKYVDAEITYTFRDAREKLDGSTIHKWLSVDDDFKVTINKDKVKEYVEDLSKSYNTIGRTRSFKTPSGKSIKVSGGDYGWSIHRDKEVEELIKDIKEGKSITKEPVYSQRAFAHGKNDIGNTFVEIDLAKQHMWFYKNGKLIVNGDIVTGNVSKNHTTPKGIYRLKYKAKNVVLRGPDYASPVTYWMPFNRGIGIHDANWRSVFGGKIYKKDGSHGCINSPYNVAKTIYNNIEVNTPIICH